MIEYLKFHAAKFLIDAIPLILIFLPLAWFIFVDEWRKWRCKHPSYWENSRCNGICSKCGKDLGFIDDVRKKYGSGF